MCTLPWMLLLNAQSAAVESHPDGNSAWVTDPGAAAEFAARQSGLVAAGIEDLVEIAGQCLHHARELDPQNPVWIAALARFQRTRAASSHDPREKLAALKEAASLAELLSGEPPFGDWRHELRTSVLPDLAAVEFEAGDLESAERHARAVLQLAAQEPKAWNHDDLVHAADTVLGRAALLRGDVDDAKARLLASAEIAGSGVLGSFGPSMALAQELLAAGQRDAVRQYLELCRAFWKNDRGRIDRYIDLLRSDATPNLLAPYGLGQASLAGENAPSFKLRDIAGREWTLAQLSNKTVMVDFWTTWCPRCREELPVLERLADDFRDRELVILAIDVGEDEAAVRGFVEKHIVKLPVLLAGEDAMILAYQVQAYPTLVVIDRTGKVAKHHTGAGSEAELKEWIGEGSGAPALKE